MYGRIGIFEIVLVVLIVSAFWHQHMTSTMREAVARSSRSNRPNPVPQTRPSAFWSVAVFAMVSMAALAAAVWIVALATR